MGKSSVKVIYRRIGRDPNNFIKRICKNFKGFNVCKVVLELENHTEKRKPVLQLTSKARFEYPAPKSDPDVRDSRRLTGTLNLKCLFGPHPQFLFYYETSVGSYNL